MFGAVLAVACGLVVIVVGAVLAAGGALVRGVLAGHGPLLAALVLGIVGAAALAVLRGAYGGTGRIPGTPRRSPGRASPASCPWPCSSWRGP